MTRIAPTRSTEVRADDVLVDARWRVGVRGSMTLSIVPGPERGAVTAIVVLGAERVIVAGRSEESELESRFTFQALSEHGVGDEVTGAGAEVVRAERRNLRRLSGFTASINLSVNASGGLPLFLTDLPTRLGLMGGTYVLESIRVRP